MPHNPAKQKACRQRSFIDIQGRRFGKWRVLRYLGNQKWLCRCACGRQRKIWGHSLRRGLTRCCAACHPSRQVVDLSGQRFGFLQVLAYAGQRKWLCICECGARRKVYGPDLKKGHTRGCRVCTHVKHGASRTSEYIIWQGIKRRCLDPRRAEYPEYGGRGITVSKRWQESFANFLADMGPRPSPAHSVERNNNDGPYAPDNCCWATMKEQAANKRPPRTRSVEEEMGIA